MRLFELTVEVPEHGLVEVNEQVTISLFANVLELNVELFVPTLLPFTFHW